MRHLALKSSIATAVLVAALFALAGGASAELSFGPVGSGAGQTKNPKGIAVDASTGNVFVVDNANNRISVFGSSGNFIRAFGWGVANGASEPQSCTATCLAGLAGSGAGQFNAPESIAVDSLSHAVYVGENANRRVQKLDPEGHFIWALGGEVDHVTHANLCTVAPQCGAGKTSSEPGSFLGALGRFPIAVRAGGSLYVADAVPLGSSEKDDYNTRIQKFEPSGASGGPQIIIPEKLPRVRDFVVDSSGAFYVTTSGSGAGLRKYDVAGEPVLSWGDNGKAVNSQGTDSLALGSSGNIFAAIFPGVSEFDVNGAQVRTFYGSLGGVPAGIAYHPTADGDIFASEAIGLESSAIRYLTIPPPGPVTFLGSTVASQIGNSKATFKVQINPEGKATEFAFQYVDEATFQADQPNGFEHATTTAFQAIPLPGGASFELLNVEKKLPLETLAPETKYHYRVVARNADAPGGNFGDEGTPFTTLGPPEVLETWATDVGSDTARLHAEVDPLLLATTGHFQYVDDATYRRDVEELGPGHGFDHAVDSPSTIDFGNGEGAVAGASQVFPLQPGTTYHYRLYAESPFAPVEGPERVLHTFAPLELVTGCPNQAFRTGPAAVLPDCRAYELVTPLDKANGDVLTRINITGFRTELNQSAADGSGFAFSSYRAFADPESAPYTSEYLARRDPSAGWETVALDPPRSGRILTEIENRFRAFTEDLSVSWMVQEGEPILAPCAPPGYFSLYRRDNQSATYDALNCGQPNLEPKLFKPELQGFSADGELAVFRVNDALEVAGGPSPSGAGNYQVYLSDHGALRLVSVLPNGQPALANASAGTVVSEEGVFNHNRVQLVEQALSEDGSRVYWSINEGSAAGPIYLRENAAAEQSESGACDEAGRACTIQVTPEPAQFQAATSDGSRALYKIASGALAGNLYEFDRETEATHLIAEGVIEHIADASEDLSRVYFASKEADAGEEAEGAVKGEPNLYLAEEGETRFIGILSDTDLTTDSTEPGTHYGSVVSSIPVYRMARTNRDGSSLAFLSNSRPLSEQTAGYDNTDAVSGRAAAEVYLFEATADGGAGNLRCVSCNPSGARPRGRQVSTGVNGGPGPWASALLPQYQSQLYQPRYLSEDGTRLFFNSYEALVLADTNGKQDAYEWVQVGTSGCEEESPTFVEASEGCLYLLSSGQSENDSEFLDASADGSDAFFTTAEGLLSQDFGLIDVYDARVNGGFPPPPPPPPACEGDACQSPAAPPNDATPASASFRGAQNPPAQRKSKHRSRKKAKKAKHKQKRHAQRRGHGKNRRAHR